ncbi:MAG: CDP-glucose 4,6-dehydratase [Proteobacteria bacterium]|nr:CDP-glucose 4,6-dehydratase [Pseudomonadota bacterium]
MFDDVYRGKRVFITGHTGFKGSWLCFWLHRLGAEVCGYALGVPTSPSNFEINGLEERITHVTGDLRDRVALVRAMKDFGPDFVFHLAAQAIVRRSYDDPATTFETNAIGTMNVLEAVRQCPSVRAGVLITSDKAYRNQEWSWGYRENDVLGGEDPYSASKGCAELIIYSYIRSFFKDGPRLASTRAGNVIGGGDWASDRIVPDAARAWSRGETLVIRSPEATRPWQHVLEPLSGYLWLGKRLWDEQPALAGEAFNFGPDARVNQTVRELLEAMADQWPGATWKVDRPDEVRKESTLLKLSCDKALHRLGWRAVLDFDETVAMTVRWYRTCYGSDREQVSDMTAAQIEQYHQKAASEGLAWTK